MTLAVPALGIERKLVTGVEGRAEFQMSAAPDLWSPENPVLYELSLSYGGEIVRDRVGFRTIRAEGGDILLNGEPVFLRGISIHEESPHGDGRAWSEEDAKILLGWAKELGCNFVRLAHYPHNENMVRMADEMGLMVWSVPRKRRVY